MIYGLLALIVCLLLGLAVWREVRRRSMDRWLGSYIMQSGRRRPLRPSEEVHVLLCIADHYEPQWGKPTAEVAARRVDNWVRDYPRLFGHFRDGDGRPPRHSFFFPLEEYEAAHVDGLDELCRQGFGEVEIHLHHDGDTADNLRQRLLAFKELLSARHGQLARHRETGELVYGFIHGDWALDNSRPDGRHCGINNELDILRETGCYADFTLPSAPDPSQTRKINSIYYAVDDPLRPKSHDWGVDVGKGPAPRDALLMIQGPLILDWRHRKWGLMPHVENSCLQGNQAPTMARLDLWLKARVQVPARPDWFFVKLYTHGAPEENQRVLLGEPMVSFHQALAERARRESHFHYHYVTAREMYNLVRAAEAGWRGTVADARDFQLLWQGARGSEVVSASNGHAPRLA
jgi:hypothetical protein